MLIYSCFTDDLSLLLNCLKIFNEFWCFLTFFVQPRDGVRIGTRIECVTKKFKMTSERSSHRKSAFQDSIRLWTFLTQKETPKKWLSKKKETSLQPPITCFCCVAEAPVRVASQFIVAIYLLQNSPWCSKIKWTIQIDWTKNLDFNYSWRASVALLKHQHYNTTIPAVVASKLIAIDL